MNTVKRPYFFYLFHWGKDIKIERMTDAKAAELWRRGQHWLDLGMETKAEAEKKRAAYFTEKSNCEGNQVSGTMQID